MFSLIKRKKKVELYPYVRRLCDLTAPNLPARLGEDRERTENRYNRTIPTILGPWEQDRPVVKQCIIGLTCDMSDRGLCLVFNQPFRAQSVVVGYWASLDAMPRPWYFLGHLRRNQALGGGFWKVGVELSEFANTTYGAGLVELNALAVKLLPPADVARKGF